MRELRYGGLHTKKSGNLRDVMANALAYDIVVSEFETQLYCFVHFRVNTLGTMNSLFLPAMS